MSTSPDAEEEDEVLDACRNRLDGARTVAEEAGELRGVFDSALSSSESAVQFSRWSPKSLDSPSGCWMGDG